MFLTFFNFGVLIDASAKFMKFIPMKIKNATNIEKKTEKANSNSFSSTTSLIDALNGWILTKETRVILIKFINWFGILMHSDKNKID